MEPVYLRRPFEVPASLQICGCSFSGKSTILYKLIKESETLFTRPPRTIIYCYAHPPPEGALDNVPNLIKHHGFPEKETIEQWITDYSSSEWMLASDDLSHNFFDSDISRILMTRVVHHSNLFFCLTTHRLFSTEKNARLSSLNFHYYILTPSKRDISSYGRLSTQLNGAGTSRAFQDMFLDSTEIKDGHKPGYLYINIHPIFGIEKYKYMTNIFSDEYPLTVYRI